MMAMLFIVLVPATYYVLIKPVLYGEMSINFSLKNCKCTECTKRLSDRQALYRFKWLNGVWMAKFLVLAFFWFLCYQCFEVVKDIEPLKTFIPNELLGVEIDATVAQVKKAYRKLSREKHPDKNPDNPEAVNEFI